MLTILTVNGKMNPNLSAKTHDKRDKASVEFQGLSNATCSVYENGNLSRQISVNAINFSGLFAKTDTTTDIPLAPVVIGSSNEPVEEFKAEWKTKLQQEKELNSKRQRFSEIEIEDIVNNLSPAKVNLLNKLLNVRNPHKSEYALNGDEIAKMLMYLTSNEASSLAELDDQNKCISEKLVPLIVLTRPGRSTQFKFEDVIKKAKALLS